MPHFSSTYRLGALALALSFMLGAAWPAACLGSDGHAPAGTPHHQTAPCAGPCHATKAPKYEPATALPATDRLLTLPDFSSAGLPLSGLEEAAPPVRGVLTATYAGWPPAAPPVRLHILYAAFLN